MMPCHVCYCKCVNVRPCVRVDDVRVTRTCEGAATLPHDDMEDDHNNIEEMLASIT